MIINLNVKIKGGPRTPIQVDVYGTSVNEKTIKFANGNKISEITIAGWISDNLGIALKKMQDK